MLKVRVSRALLVYETGWAKHDEETRQSRTFRKEADIPLPGMGWYESRCWHLRRTHLQVRVTCFIHSEPLMSKARSGCKLNALLLAEGMTSVHTADIVCLFANKKLFILSDPENDSIDQHVNQCLLIYLNPNDGVA